MKLSVIILHYNVATLLRSCLNSIIQNIKYFEYEIIVVDNNSPDPEWKVVASEFPRVKFIAEKENKGFAYGNNVGVQQASGEFILLLNPDTELLGDHFHQIIQFASNQKHFGCLGVRMQDAMGNFLPESKRAVPDLFNSFEKLFLTKRQNSSKSYYRNDIDEYETAPTEVITGAFFLCRRSVYLDVGGLDERYFMYGEDIDLCYTLLRNGFRNWYYGGYSILHYKGESTVKDALYLRRFYGAMQVFLTKYYKEAKPFHYVLLSAGLRFKWLLEHLKLKAQKNRLLKKTD